jgi:CMP-N-acetylneuraminic acid synthetase
MTNFSKIRPLLTASLKQLVELALITARGASKGLPGKNIIDLAGKPMIVYTIDAALQSGVAKRVLVSTDDAAIAEVSRAAGAEVLMRPAGLAQDHSSSLDVIEHALAECNLTAGYFCLLQPTSPLRNAKHLREAAEMLENSGATSVISVSELDHHPLKSLIRQTDGSYAPVRQLGDLISARQALPQAIAPNGAIYFCDIPRFRAGEGLFYPDTAFYLMSARDSVDIDSHTDLVRAESYLTERKFQNE